MTLQGENFPQIFLVPGNIVYLIMHVAHIMYQFFYKKGDSLDIEMDVNLQQKMPYESCSLWSNFFLLCRSLINHDQPPVPHASYATIFTVLWKT